MSFSSDIKEKLCSAEFVCPKCPAYEIAGALFFGGSVSETAVKFTTENDTVAARIHADIKEAFGIDTQITRGVKTSRIDIADIYSVENIKGGMPSGAMPFACCRASYARGAFLGGGSVTDPVKGYHLEFDTRDRQSAEYLRGLLKKDGFELKITERKGYYVVYLKGSDKIVDLLGYMGAASGAFELYSVQIEREMRNTVNRRVNCETANTNKAAKASGKHLVAIKKIRKAKKWDKLPDVLKEIAALREEYPEDSLKELGEKTDPPIGKSGVNHRLNRIIEMADNL
ncbi:MAG: DNA-binding protein WhiA [Clostridia bacterium]|nr:DNA-binding protein WhiA [Clostridia bacterium]